MCVMYLQGDLLLEVAGLLGVGVLVKRGIEIVDVRIVVIGVVDRTGLARDRGLEVRLSELELGPV